MSAQIPRRRTSPWIVWPVCVFLFVVMYLASFGPVTWLVFHQWISAGTYSRFCQTIYFPIEWITSETRGGNTVVRAYWNYIDWVAGPAPPPVQPPYF